MVATGPMPGSTPISVPSSAPMKQNSRFCGVSATPKPKMMLLNRSIGAQENGHTGIDSLRPKTNSATAPAASPNASASASPTAEFEPASRPEEHDRDRRDRKPGRLDQQREGDNRGKHEEKRAQMPTRGFRALRDHALDRDDAAEQHQSPAQQHRHIARPHTQRRAARIVARDPQAGDAEGREHQPGGKVAVEAKAVHYVPRRMTIGESRGNSRPHPDRGKLNAAGYITAIAVSADALSKSREADQLPLNQL